MTTFDYVVPSAAGTLKLGEVERVADVLRRGGLAVLPTETGYLLGADATDDAAVRAAFAVKRRPLAATMHVVCSSLAMAGRFAALDAAAVRVLGALTPGPVSVVTAQRDAGLSPLVLRDGTVGLRVPDHPATLQVVEALGRPVTATSLNESGSASVSVRGAELRALEWPPDAVVPVVDAGDEVAYPTASTLVRVVDGRVEVLRPGPVSAEAVGAVLA